MSELKVRLLPQGLDLVLERGDPLGGALGRAVSLADLLAVNEVEFPCGGKGVCRGCRVRVVSGTLEPGEKDRARLSPEELAQGWRLACQARPQEDLVLELRQWSAQVLTDQTSFAFKPAEGLGLAVDIGTTTMAAQLLDLKSGQVLGTRTALNPQARYGADIMSRICFALSDGGGPTLEKLVKDQLAGLVAGLMEQAPKGASPARAVLVGNTAMHHLFLGHPMDGLASYPFEGGHPEGAELSGVELGWKGAESCRALFLPNLGGFVGSDILAVILATGMHKAADIQGAADLGTNGEIVFGNRDVLWVASTAAGPAFEGAKISQGMRAARGAVDRVSAVDGRLETHVIGGGAATGVCGSGLVDAVARGLDLGLLDVSGRVGPGGLEMKDGVRITQKDIRELLLAKAAIATGMRILGRLAGLGERDRAGFFLAGAFGKALDLDSGRRIGLFTPNAADIVPVGNAALLGAKMALFTAFDSKDPFADILSKTRHVSLEKDPDFQEMFVDQLGFPETAP